MTAVMPTLSVNSSSAAVRWTRWLVWISAGLLMAVVVRNAWNAYQYRQSVFALRCDEPVFDCQTKLSGDEVRHTFQVTNVSRRAVEITSVIAECGCTTIASELNGRIILPGESFDVPAELSLEGISAGEFDKRILIGFDEDPTRKLLLKLQGKVEPLWTWTPERVVFDDVPIDQPSSRIVMLRRHPQASPTVLNHLFPSRFLSAEIIKQPQAGAQVWSIRVTTKPRLRVGREDGSVFLQTADEPGFSFAIPVAIIAVNAEPESRRHGNAE